MALSTTAGNRDERSSEGLIRAIGPWSLGANAVNNTVGAGIFVLPALVAGTLGPDAVVAYLLCGVVITLVLSCFVEIGTLVDRSGGPVAYVEEAFGPLAGFLAWAVFAVVSVAGVQAALTNALLDPASIAFPSLANAAPRILVMSLLRGSFWAVNIFGGR